ncbi:hypothetical protein DICVIV_11316 [Dictyocaulus viviparus]|uniref:ShKT domain-containing protein n=1 Tax=Dictyocaulus viviparus TaxID=29172 RepID=A0A0D8XG66_DICVI|nr:hypothetical protein DICVIV_11316 [Dictyocaulus viviparus]
MSQTFMKSFCARSCGFCYKPPSVEGPDASIILPPITTTSIPLITMWKTSTSFPTSSTTTTTSTTYPRTTNKTTRTPAHLPEWCWKSGRPASVSRLLLWWSHPSVVFTADALRPLASPDSKKYLSLSKSAHLTCNETLGVEDSERNKDSIVRRFPSSQSANPSAFRANYSTSVSSVKYTIQKPVPKSPFLTTNPASHMTPAAPGTSAAVAPDDSAHGQLQTASHSQLQNNNASRHYKTGKFFLSSRSFRLFMSGNSEFPASTGIPPSQLQIFAGSALLRNAVAAAGLVSLVGSGFYEAAS